MTNDPQHSPLFTHIDVSTHSANTDAGVTDSGGLEEVSGLLKQLVIGQQKQNQILNELVQQLGAAQKQRASELGQWRDANPHLARQCRQAAEALSDVQTQFLRNLTEEINDNADGFLDGDFLLNEFVDRFGPRLAHLNGVLQVLSQLSASTTTSSAG